MKTETANNYCQIKKDPDLFRKTVFSVCENYVVTDENKIILNNLFDYAHNEGAYDPKKGIAFIGDIGTGKSTLIKILSEYKRNLGVGFRIVNCGTIASNYASFGIESIDEHTYNDTNVRIYGKDDISMDYAKMEKAFDELGREQIPAKHYGNELNVMQHIFQIRYDLRLKTHITTNLNLIEFENKYGSHIYDRAFEMFNFIELKGESFRK